jgi:hypothetical protein
MEDKIPQSAIDSIAEHINHRNNKSYSLPVLGNPSNIETPQVFEIMPFDQIDNSDVHFYAIDGSYNSHSFYNGVSIGLYRCGYICFQGGKQIRMNHHDDPVIYGKTYTPHNILITCDDHMFAIYDELLSLPPIEQFISFLKAQPDDIFSYKRDLICSSTSNLLAFCQDILEWSLIFEIVCREEIKEGDFILRDGNLRSLYIKQEYLVKLGNFLAKEKKVIVAAITKNSPVKLELAYTFKQIDSYLQDKLKAHYPFRQKDPKSQKLCCWFEVPDAVLQNAYSGTGSMYAKKALKGGRGFGFYFASRLDYVEKLQNYDWVVVDINLFDGIPNIDKGDMLRNYDRLKSIFYELTRLTQEHYILGYPYPLVEAHNLVTLKTNFKEEIINRVKHSMYSTQHMDNIDIENMFLDIHSRF